MEETIFPKTIQLGEYEFKFLTELEVERDNNGEVITRSTRDIIGRYEDITNYYKGVFCSINNYNPKEIMMKNNIDQDFAGYYFLITDNKKLLNGVSSSKKNIIKNINEINKFNDKNNLNNIIKNTGLSSLKNGKDGSSKGNPTYSKLNILTGLMKKENHKVAVYIYEEKNFSYDQKYVNEIKFNLENSLINNGYEKITYDLERGCPSKYEINENKDEKLINNNIVEKKYNLAPHYQWIDYFKLLTDKILEYKNNRNEFRKKVINVLSEYSKIGNYEISGIDPLSFIYELARLWIRKDKKIIYSKVAEEFNIQCDLGNIGKWIFLNPIRNTFFYYGNELLDNDIHWNIFIMAKNINFIDEKIFQEILEIKNISIAKLTQVLSIIEPDKYIPYDQRTTNYSQIDYNKNEHQYINYKKHIETIQSLFPKCSLYEASIFMKINDKIKKNLNRKIYQISSYMRNGYNGKDDHIEIFYKDSVVYVDGEKSSGSGATPYPINEPKKGDIMVARYGSRVNGVGIIINNQYETGFTLDKRIYVIWVNKTSYDNILRKPQDIALKEMTEQDILQCKNVYRETFKILGIDGMENKEIKDIKNIFEFKKQIILQGAPGTGKTYTAKKVAEAMGCGYEVIQFHPSYTYEDFVRGIVSKTEGNNIKYEVEDKILMNAIEKAKEHEKYILIIDEINRANLPSVLGELLYALEYREEPVICPYKKDKEDDGKIIIPKNLYIIGTMNTADRSIGNIDYAVRRRFAFYTVKANEEYIKDDYSKKVFKYIKNEIIEKHLSEEYYIDDIMIGHSYFIFSDEAYSDEDLAYKYMNLSLQYNIIPLLEEYYKDGILIDNETDKVKDKIKELKEKYSEAEQ